MLIPILIFNEDNECRKCVVFQYNSYLSVISYEKMILFNVALDWLESGSSVSAYTWYTDAIPGMNSLSLTHEGETLPFYICGEFQPSVLHFSSRSALEDVT